MKQLKPLFWISVAFMFLMSVSFLAMPVASELAFDGNTLLLPITGAWFWVTFISGYVLFILANRKRKKLTAKKDNKEIAKLRPGILNFFKNKWAIAADILSAVSLTGFILFAILNSENYATYTLLFATVFFIQMHCVLNGENFRYITQYQSLTGRNL